MSTLETILALIAAIALIVPFFIWFIIKLDRYRNNQAKNYHRNYVWWSFGIAWSVAVCLVMALVLVRIYG